MLRDYQLDIVNRVHNSWIHGHKRPCIVLPCGAGKSIISAEIAKRATYNGKNVLFIVHRKELCEQIKNTFQNHDVDMVKCNICMVQTVTRRLAAINKPDLIITDESHHALAKSYRNIYNYFKNSYGVGVTATPIRLNGSGLGDVYDDILNGVSAKWLIENKYLSPYDYYAPSVADLSRLKVKNGDYEMNEAENMLNLDTIYGDVIGHYKNLSGGAKAICYCVSVNHSRATATAFCAAGIPAAHVCANTDIKTRTEAMKAFRSGDIKLLCNADLYSEGIDIEDCGVSILLRPTKSLTLFIQQSMRCMRYVPGKRALIIDHVGNYTRHGMPDDDREWKLDSKKGESINKNTFSIRQCPYCYAVLPLKTAVCCKCGEELIKNKEYKLNEIKTASLEKITNYSSPKECRDMEALRVYAKSKGYKPGWAYYMGKSRGLI